MNKKHHIHKYQKKLGREETPAQAIKKCKASEETKATRRRSRSGRLEFQRQIEALYLAGLLTKPELRNLQERINNFSS